jgi:hypothetical protein
MDLTPQQEADARRIYDVLKAAAEDDLLALARLLASKPDSQIFGQTEFQVRDLVHKIGAKAIEAALDGRKKGGTRGPAPAARPATAPPASSATPPAAP